MKVRIAKFELYPREEPKSYAVGFQVTASNNRSFYIDTTIPLTEASGKNDDEIAGMAWEELKEQINKRVEALESRREILAQKEWIPPEKREDEDWDLIKEE